MSVERRIERVERKHAGLRSGKPEKAPRLEAPHIVEFATSPSYLGRSLYPRQMTLLKVVFLADELFTDFDREVIAEWAMSYKRSGNRGIQPDVLTRIAICKEQGRSYFREVVAVIGRRGGKNHIGAIAAAYVTWRYLCLGNPQAHYGLDPGQRMSLLVFAGNRLQAQANQFKDIVRMITDAPCFAPYIAQRTTDRLALFTPNDLRRRNSRFGAAHRASLHIMAKEATEIAGRGPTSYAQVYDEMAHVLPGGSNRSAEEIYDAATPALDQFGHDAFIYEPSSPWQSTGQFFANYQRSLELHPDGTPAYPELLMVQLTSFDLYENWERAHKIPMVPGGAVFPKFSRAIQEYDDDMYKLERANPETFAVERLSRFATVRDAYLHPDRFAAMFGSWGDATLRMQTEGVLQVGYKAHADPSKSEKNFALAIAHAEKVDGVTHVVFDFLHVWRPQDFPGRRIDYVEIENELWYLIQKFMPYELTFDQWNSAGLISGLQRRVHQAQLPRGVAVYERTATARVNWDRAETFKTALGMGIVHAPFRDGAGRVYPSSELLEMELRYLQDLGGRVDHATSGPVQTKDLADAAMECVTGLLNANTSQAIGRQLGELALGASMPAGTWGRPQSSSEYAQAFSQFGRAQRRRMRYRSSAARGGRFHD
jgi:hypothetical protein